VAKAKCFVCGRGGFFGTVMKVKPVFSGTHDDIWLHQKCMSKAPPEFHGSSGHENWQREQSSAPQKILNKLAKRNPKTNIQISNFVNDVQSAVKSLNGNRCLDSKEKRRIHKETNKLLEIPQVREWLNSKKELKAVFGRSDEYVTAVMSNTITKEDAIKLHKSPIRKYLLNKTGDRLTDYNKRPFESETEPFLDTVMQIERCTLDERLPFNRAMVMYKFRDWKEGVGGFINHYLINNKTNRLAKADTEIIELFSVYRNQMKLYKAVLSSKIKLERARRLLIDWNFAESTQAIDMVLKGAKPRDVASKLGIKPSADEANPFSGLD
jgi:hypothetical protein